MKQTAGGFEFLNRLIPDFRITMPYLALVGIVVLRRVLSNLEKQQGLSEFEREQVDAYQRLKDEIVFQIYSSDACLTKEHARNLVLVCSEADEATKKGRSVIEMLFSRTKDGRYG